MNSSLAHKEPIATVPELHTRNQNMVIESYNL